MFEANIMLSHSMTLLGLAIVGVMMGHVAFAEEESATEAPVDGEVEKHGPSMIFPGTKWCGVGSIASGPDELGIYSDTDACCREHDNCPDLIPAMHTKYGLRNLNRSSRLSCECDEKFLECLTNVGSLSARAVRGIYMGVQTQCFKFDYPIVGCNSLYRNTLRCMDYILNTTAPKKFQWFDLVVK